MHTKLDNIIRKFLTEQLKAKIVVETDRLDASGKSEIQKFLPFLNLNEFKSAVGTTSNEIDGFYVTLKRRGTIPKDLENSITFGKTEALSTALQYLNGPNLGAGWGRFRSKEYVWFLKDLSKTKTDKLVNNYKILCFYIKISIFKESVRNSLINKNIQTGLLQYFSSGATVFSGEEVELNKKEWTPAAIGKGTMDYGTLTPPINDANFGDISSDTARKIWMWFDGEKLGVKEYIPNNNYMYYGCVQREIVKWFQKKNNLTVTGNWGKEDRIKAKNIASGSLMYLDKTSGMESYYTLGDPLVTDKSLWFTAPEIEQLKKDIETCQIETKEIEASTPATSNIIVPSGGFKKGAVTLPEDKAEFYKFQQLMIDKYILLNSMFPEAFPLTLNSYVTLTKALKDKPEIQGTYGNATQDTALFIAQKSGYTGNDLKLGIVTDSLIKHLENITKTNLLKK